MAIINKIINSLSSSPAMFVLCVILFTVASPTLTRAQEWRLEPIFKAGLVIDDNASLSIRTDDEVELTGYLLDARVDINYKSDTTTFFLQPRALIRTYPGESDFDSDDFFLRSQFRHNGKTSSFGFRVNFDEQSIRTGERTDSDLEIDDPDEISDDDTGRVGLEGDRSRWRLAPFWNYQISNVSSLRLRADYLDTRYDKVLAGRLEDYTDSRISLSYGRAFSNTTTGIFRLTGRRFETARLSSDNTGYAALAGFERRLTENTKLTALIGVENTDLSMGKSDSEVIGSVTLTRDLQIITMFTRYKRSVAANGSGKVEIRDTINMNFNRRLNEKISAGLGIRAYHAEEIGSSSSIGDRNYVQLQTKFIWYLTKAFVIEADYRYTILDRSNAIGERSNSNEIGIWFVYQPRTIPKI